MARSIRQSALAQQIRSDSTLELLESWAAKHQNLQEAVKEGFITRRQLARDSSFVSLHGNSDFQQLIAGHDN